VFALNAWQRWKVDTSGTAAPTDTPGVALTVIGAVLLAASGWLGWTLVQTFHVGVLEVHEGGAPPT
jgi:uncharacterized membrane protein